jgi:EXS family
MLYCKATFLAVNSLSIYIIRFPFLVRFKQCLFNGGFTVTTQLNACKYAVSILALILTTVDLKPQTAFSGSPSSTPLLTGWTLSLLALSFILNFSWDICMDWRLINIVSHTKHVLYYGVSVHTQSPPISKIFLILIVAFNFWVRLLPFSRYIQGPLYLSGIALSTHLYLGLEILRRWLWTLLRLYAALYLVVPKGEAISSDCSSTLYAKLEATEVEPSLLEHQSDSFSASLGYITTS